MNDEVSVSVDDLDRILRSIPPSVLVSEGNWETYRRLVTVVELKLRAKKLPVMYVDYGINKIGVIKAIRSVLGIGLREAKDISELPLPINLRDKIDLPTMPDGLILNDGQVIHLTRAMREAGATISFKG